MQFAMICLLVVYDTRELEICCMSLKPNAICNNLPSRNASEKGTYYLLQVPETAKLALEAVQDGMCVVIGLQSTGEANTTQVRDVMGDAMDDFISAPRQVLLAFLENHFPTHACGLTESGASTLHAQVWPSVFLKSCLIHL